jgi:hypothetical protein
MREGWAFGPNSVVSTEVTVVSSYQQNRQMAVKYNFTWAGLDVCRKRMSIFDSVYIQ